MCFSPQIFFLIKSSSMARRGRKLMALDQDYMVDAAELPTFAFATRLLPRLNCEVHHAEASLQQSVFLVSFV
jgi:hypothetical protein